MEKNIEMVTIPKEVYDELCTRDLWLRALVSTGVDNWEGYNIAIDLYDEWLKDEE